MAMALALSASAVAAFLVPGAARWLEYDRGAIAGGELWRLVTGHLAHWSAEHLAWDLIAFLALGVLCERESRARFLACAAGATVTVSLALWWAMPGLDRYRGLSGLDSALFVLLAVSLIRQGVSRGVLAGAWALVALLGKLAWEGATGGALFVHDPGLAAVPLAHLAGALVGFAVGVARLRPTLVARHATTTALTVLIGASAASADTFPAADPRAILSEAARVTAGIADEGEKAELYRLIATAQAAAGDRAHAARTFELAVQTAVGLRTRTVQYATGHLTSIARAQAEAGDLVSARSTFGHAIDMAHAAPDPRDRATTLSRIASEQAKVGQLDDAATAATAIGDPFERASALVDLAMGRIREGDAEGALRTVTTIEDPHRLASALAAVAILQAETGDRAGAATTIARALAVATGVPDRDRRTAALEAIARAQTLAGYLPGALGTIGRIPEGSHTFRTVGVLTELAVAQWRAGDHGVASATLTRARARAIKLPKSRFKGLSPRAIALADVALAAARMGDATRARDILREVPGAVEAVQASLEVAEVRARAGDRAGASLGYDQALTVAMRLPASAGRDAMAAEIALARARAGHGPWDEALATARSIAHAHLRARAMAAVIQTLTESGDVPAALRVAAELPDDRDRVLALWALAPVQARRGDVPGALATLARVTDDSRRADAARQVADAQAQAGQAAEALAWASRETSPLVKSQALLGVAEGILAARGVAK
jgi:rhomboid family GlyGly-CTERM serine protease